jgi:acyl-CoA thioester hydrolase
MNNAERTAATAFRHEFTVPQTVIDANGHVNNVVFVQWMQDVATRHFESVAGTDAMKSAGAMWVARSHTIEYFAPAFVGDRIQVTTWVASFGRVRSLRRYEFVRMSDGKLLVKGETDWVFVRASDRRPCSIPEPIKRAFGPLPEDQKL